MTGAFLMFIAIMAIFVIRAAVNSGQSWRDTLEELAARLKLTYHAGSFLKGSKVTGTIGRFPVVVDSHTVSTGKSSQTYTRIRVQTGHRMADITLAPEGLMSGLKKAFVGSDVEVGDRPFDEAVVVRGQSDVVVSRLNAAARLAAIRVIGRTGARLKGGELKFQRSGYITDADHLRGLVDDLVGLARALDSDQTTAERLLDNALHDPVRQVQETNLSLLLARHPKTEAAVEAAEHAADHPNAALRLSAARALGERGRVLLAAIIRDPTVSRYERERAITALMEAHREAPETADALKAVLRQVGSPVLHDALLALEELGTPAELSSLIPQRFHPRVDGRQAVARALGAYETPESIDVLLKLLEDESQEVRLAAIESLERVGDLGAVERLLPMTRGFFVDGDIKRMARRAVASIQARAGDVEGGRLSMSAEAAGGELSQSAGEGALSEVGEGAEGTDEDEQDERDAAVTAPG